MVRWKRRGHSAVSVQRMVGVLVPEERAQLLSRAAKAVLDLTSDVVVVIDATDHTFCASLVNQAFIESTGWTRDEVVGRSALDLFPPQIAEEIEQRLTRVVHRCEPARYEVDHEVPAGRRWYDVSLWPLLTSDGRCRHVVALTRDVTGVRQATKALAETQELAQIGHWSWDLEADELHWSDELYRIYGLRPGELEPSFDGFLARVHPEDQARTRERIEEARTNGGAFVVRHRVLRPDGQQRVLIGRGRVIHDRHGDAVRMAGTGQDITAEHRRAEQQLAGLSDVPGMEEVLAALPERLDPGFALDWLTTPRDELDGRSVVAWLAHGAGADQVLALVDGIAEEPS